MRPIVVLLACAFLAACGSDDGRLSADEYRDEGNELCAEVTDRIEEIDAPRSIDGMADYLERLLELSRPYDRRFSELDPPEELAQRHERAVAVNEKLNEKFGAMVDRLREAADPAVTLRRQLERLLPTIEQGDEVFRKLGLEGCLGSPQLSSPDGLS